MNQITVRWSLSAGVVGHGVALPSGRFAVLANDGYIACEWGYLPQPPGGALLFPDEAENGHIIGQTHQSNTIIEFNGADWVPLAAAVGPYAAVYRPDSTPALIVTVADYQATGGWRYCREDGLLVSVASSYADAARGLYAWTEWPDVAIGQGDDEKVGGGVVVRFSDDGVLRRFAFETSPGVWSPRREGFLRDIRAKRAGDSFAIAVVDYQQALTTLTWCTLAELRELPPVEAVAVAIPTFAFTHPVIVAPFKDPAGTSGATHEIAVNQTGMAIARPHFAAEDSLNGLQGELLGVYTEKSEDPSSVIAIAQDLETRVLVCRDAPGPWTPPALRAWDIPARELYLVEGETVSQSQWRWRAEVDALLAQWPGDVGVIPMFYCAGGAPPDELWLVTDVLDGLRVLSEIVNRSPRIKVVAPFAYERANGIVGHVELQQAFANLLDAGARAGLATLMPVGTTQPPEPPIEPPTPEPDPPYPPIDGGHMDTERGWLIGPGDQVLQVDAAGGVSFVSPELSDAALLEATPIDGDARGRVEVRPVPHPQFLVGGDATAFTPSGEVGRQYYTTTGGRGNYESWSFGKWPSGIVQAVVEYIDQGANHGRPFQGAGLTWVKQS